MPSATWVVYEIPTKDSPAGVRAVCDGREWAALDAARPGYFTLVRAGITNEGEAERLARGTAGDARPRNPAATATSRADLAAAALDGAKAPAG